MINFKEVIAKSIAKKLDMGYEEIALSIEIPKEEKQGDYAFPCFRLAKIFKKSPQAIAEEINKELEIDNNLIQKTEVIRWIS